MHVSFFLIVARVQNKSKRGSGGGIPDFVVFRKVAHYPPESVTVLRMGFRERNKGTGLNAAVSMGQITTFEGITISGIPHPTCPSTIRAEGNFRE